MAAENALRRFDESGDGIRLRLFCRRGLEESAWTTANTAGLLPALEAAVAMMDWFESDENAEGATHAQAYYTFVKGQYEKWDAARTAIREAKRSGK